MRRLLLDCGTAAAVLYFLTLIVASLTWPGYSHVTQYVSELGSAAAPHPGLFNTGILAAGALGLLGALGMFLHFTASARALSGALAALSFAAWSVGMVFGGLFPMPNPLHNAFGIILGVAPLPLLLMLALRGRIRPSAYVLLALWQAAVAVLLAILFGWGGLVTLENVGLWQRGFALALIPGIGFACAFLARLEPKA